MKRLPVLLTLLAALACALLALAGQAAAEEVQPPMLTAGQPGSVFDFPASTCQAQPQAQQPDPPGECYVCGPMPGFWPDPGPGTNGQVGPQCIPNVDKHYTFAPCTCPATGGGTIGGTRTTTYICNSHGFWVYHDTSQCRTGGNPSWCQ